MNKVSQASNKGHVYSGTDPGEVKWVNFHPLFLSTFFLFFSYPSNIDLKHLNQALVLLYYYKNSPPISKSWIRQPWEWRENCVHGRPVWATTTAQCTLGTIQNGGREKIINNVSVPYMLPSETTTELLYQLRMTVEKTCIK